ncbi:SCO1/SenC family protein [Hyphomonas polymorpha PS728]|uniref:SCO1/SenC family protein n=2 Tax=Hyphomonas polymorpha TaxID=74319 RepID=A0A062VAH2_9PROT|nr:SCO1/SenC family protein [Hyphomonas polymorpha PS728]
MPILCGSLSLAPSAGMGAYRRMRNSFAFALPALFLLAACGASDAPASGGGIASSGGMKSGCASRAYSEIGGPISLIDQTGARVTEDNYKGKPTVVYFGFTYCPDVCPAALSTLGAAYRRLPEGETVPQTLLITVDPDRDTPEALATYVTTPAFPPGLVGLTGSAEEIRGAADHFKADYARIEQPESLAEYTMDHTNLIYVMDEDWKLKTFFTHEDTPETISACLAELF